MLGGARRFGALRGRRGAGHIVAYARIQLVLHKILEMGKDPKFWNGIQFRFFDVKGSVLSTLKILCSGSVRVPVHFGS